MPNAFLMPHSGYHMYALVAKSWIFLKITESVKKYSSDLVLGVTCLYMTYMMALMSQTFLIRREFLFFHLIIFILYYNLVFYSSEDSFFQNIILLLSLNIFYIPHNLLVIFLGEGDFILYIFLYLQSTTFKKT